MQSNGPANLILELTLEFAFEVMAYCDILNEQHRYVISNQLMRSAISIGANVREAQNAESKADFIHKMKIAAKEADEAQFYLTLCERGKDYPVTGTLKAQLLSIIKVLSKIIGTSKRAIKGLAEYST